MKSEMKFVTVAAMVLAMGANTAIAQGGGRGMADRFEMVDTDGDGRLSAAEAQEWRESVFSAMDADGDGQLTREEFMAVQMGPGADPEQRGPRFEEKQAEKDAAFTEMDQNADGFVTREQFLEAGAGNFAAADADGDGYVTMPEFIAARWGM